MGISPQELQRRRTRLLLHKALSKSEAQRRTEAKERAAQAIADAVAAQRVVRNVKNRGY